MQLTDQATTSFEQQDKLRGRTAVRQGLKVSLHILVYRTQNAGALHSNALVDQHRRLLCGLVGPCDNLNHIDETNPGKK